MANPILQVERRTQLGKRAARRLRREGKLPAILYGHKEDALALSVGEKEFEAALHAGTRMFRIRWDDNMQDALVKEMQYDTFGGKILHVDFMRVAMDEEVTIEVPIELRGTPVGVTKGGMLEHILREVNVRCLPAAIPERLDVDVSGLDIGGHLELKDVPLPSGVKVVHDDPNVVVAQVKMLAVKEEEVVLPEEEEAAKEPEVIAKKPKEGEGES